MGTGPGLTPVGAATRTRAPRPRARQTRRLLALSILGHAAISLFTAAALSAQPVMRPAWRTTEGSASRAHPTPISVLTASAVPGDTGWTRSVVFVAAGASLALRRPVVSSLPAPDRWFGRDKWLHAAVAASLQFTAYALLSTHGASRSASHLGATFLTGAVSVGKEWHDARSGGVFSRKDLVWDAIGALAGSTAAHQIDGS